MSRRRITMREKVNTLYTAYRKIWSRQYDLNFIYRFTGRDRTRTCDIIRAHGLSECKRRLTNFFMDKNRWLVPKRHPYDIFLHRFDEYKYRKRDNEKKKKADIINREEFDIQSEIKKREKDVIT